MVGSAACGFGQPFKRARALPGAYCTIGASTSARSVTTVLSFLVRLLITALAVLVASYLLPPDLFSVGDIQAAIVFAFVLGLLNAIVRPILTVITLPLSILTLGLFALVLNALVFWLASAVVPGVQVGGFLGAFLASLIVTVVSALASHLIH